MRVFFTPRARAALERMARRWRATARVPEVLDEDIAMVVERLTTSPTSGVVARRSARRTVFRVSTERTRLFVFYVVDEAKKEVVILQLWSQLRGVQPRL